DAEAGDVALFTRTTTVRQFRVNDLTAPLDGGEPAHLKEITVAVEGSRESGHVFGAGKVIAVRVFKSQ
ncbi:MAG TPA: hypothetical protein VLF66_12445, partial [Thermoanaerobaculia bacterium]|nr:hypothetical protein [Thermoanaerobaculia bacterium]